MVSADSDTTNLIVSPKVDDDEFPIEIEALTSSFTGNVRPGHNNIMTTRFKIGMSGQTLSYRIEDNSTHSISVQKVITEVVPVAKSK